MKSLLFVAVLAPLFGLAAAVLLCTWLWGGLRTLGRELLSGCWPAPPADDKETDDAALPASRARLDAAVRLGSDLSRLPRMRAGDPGLGHGAGRSAPAGASVRYEPGHHVLRARSLRDVLIGQDIFTPEREAAMAAYQRRLAHRALTRGWWN